MRGAISGDRSQSGQYAIQRAREEVRSGLVKTERRLDLQQVHLVACGLDDDSAVTEQLADLCWLSRSGLECDTVAHQFDAEVQTFSVDGTDELVSLRELLQA